MNYETFKSSAVTAIQKHFGETATVSIHSITKNNNLQLDGLTIQESSVNISPTIYLNYYYDEYLSGKSFTSIVDDILHSYQEHLPNQSIDLSFFTDYSKVKYHIIYKLVHYQKNIELLKDVPHYRFLDLAVVFCCFLPNTERGNATILIHNHHLTFWNITADMLYDAARKNTPILLPFTVSDIRDVLKSMCPGIILDTIGIPDDFPTIYVLTNTMKFYGASCILYPDVLATFAASKDCDFYIIPSSIHEVLLIPKREHSRSTDLNQIIQDVNLSHVQQDEVLSDHTYLFERSTNLITL